MTRKAMLVILDGFGEGEPSAHNAIDKANTPTWDRIRAEGDFLTIDASGESVGLPAGQMGNSEVGHMHIGAGRVIQQELARINQAISDNSWAQNPTLKQAFATSNANQSKLHIMGLLSPGGVHAHEEHIFSLIELARTQCVQEIVVHAFLDGRDTPPRSAEASLEKLSRIASQHGVKVGSITGRYYAMDRDKRWDRVAACFNLLTNGESDYQAQDAVLGLQAAYRRDEDDEFVQPTRLSDFQPIESDDVVIFMNFRADRARELSTALTDPDFAEFECAKKPSITLYTLTRYQEDLDARVIFEPQSFHNTLGEVIANKGLKQLRIAETEKYAHVTFFLNGGREAPFPGEDRILVPSPKVATYDLQPEMSAEEVTDKLCEAFNETPYDLTVVNYANADMVGHTGNLEATIKAIETLDHCLAELLKLAETHDIELLITADHGNAECMFNESTEQAHTAHTHNFVPCVHVGSTVSLSQQSGSLIDIAPTMLSLMDIELPAEMSGQPLFEIQS